MDSRCTSVCPRTSPRYVRSRRSVLFRGPPCEYAPDESQRTTETPPAAASLARSWSPRVPRQRRVSDPNKASKGVKFHSYRDGVAPCGVQSIFFLTVPFSLDSPSAARPTQAKNTSRRQETANFPTFFVFH